MEHEDKSAEATRFGSSQPNIAKSAGTGEIRAARQPDPTSTRINKSRKEAGALSDGERTEHVADAGDAG